MQAVRAELEGLQEATEYRFRLVAKNPEGKQEAEELTFETWGPPKLVALRASDASQSTATLEAEIDPSGFDTSYRFEWGPSAAYGNFAPASLESIGGGTAMVRVTQPIAGLATAATYHYRLIAQSSAGELQSEDQTLQTLNSCGLPDNRCFELASRRMPGPYAQPGSFLAGTEIHFQAAEEGNSLAYVAELGYPEASRGGEILYQGRRGEGGWESTQLAPPVSATDEQHFTSSLPSSYFGLSPDLSCGVIGSTQPLTSDPTAELTLKAGGANLYRRNPDATYTLITDSPPEPLEGLGKSLANSFNLAGFSEDCSKVYFSSGYHYAGLPGVGATRLYEWSEEDGLRYAGFVPKAGGGEEAVQATPGGGEDIHHAVSADGSRLFFSAKRKAGKVSGELGKTGVFVRQGGTSTDVSASETATADSGATYQGATPDGSRVYFTANHGLTAESSPAGTDLYEYDFARPEGERLTDISVGHEAGGAEAGGYTTTGGFYGALAAVAPDGSHAYYVARGRLVPGQGRSLAGNEAANTFSLYDYEAASESVRFAGTITAKDLERVTLAVQGQTTSRISPEGRYLLFESRADVTGYDSGGTPQAYLYDAQAPAARPTVCLSCRQDGSASADAGISTP